eukprot:UN0219
MHQCCNVPYIGHDVMKTILFDKGAAVARSVGAASVVAGVVRRARFRQCVQQASLQQRRQVLRRGVPSRRVVGSLVRSARVLAGRRAQSARRRLVQ